MMLQPQYTEEGEYITATLPSPPFLGFFFFPYLPHFQLSKSLLGSRGRRRACVCPCVPSSPLFQGIYTRWSSCLRSSWVVWVGPLRTLRTYNSHTRSSKISFIEFPFFPTSSLGLKSLFLERFSSFVALS